MLKVWLPVMLASGVLVLLVWFVGDASRALSDRRRRKHERALTERSREQSSRETHVVRRSRLSLLRAREARAVDQVAGLLGESDVDLLPQRQVAELVVAVEEIAEVSWQPEVAGDADRPLETYERAVVRAETLVETAAHDLRVARLAGEDPLT